MLDVLSDGFREAKLKFQGKATLTEELVDEVIGTVRRSLLEADVEYGVAKKFLENVKQDTVGTVVRVSAGSGDRKLKVNAGDHFVKICQEQLESLMGPVETGLDLPKNRPAVIMMVGLQGCGKTTTTGKIARFLQKEEKRKPLLVAADIYRPAAVDQLKVLGERLGVPVFHIAGASPVEICAAASKFALESDCDTILLDTAGRLAIDTELMQELVDIKAATHPDNILFVCDAMMGQDAVTTARTFNDTLDFSGVVVTKLDGDSRGGAALSIKEVTGKPIKFLGMGEDLERLEQFRPEGLASRILGMGDVLGLVDDFTRVAGDDHEQEAMRLMQGQFSYRDFYKQIQTIQKMGPMKDLVSKLPMQDMIPKDADINDGAFTQTKAIIDSMTKRERDCIDPLNPSRIRRIAKGSGSKVQDVEKLVKQFNGMKKMMSAMGKNMGGLLGKIPGMGGLGQLNQLRKAMKGGGMPAMPGGMGMPDLAGMFGGEGGLGKRVPVDRDKQRKARKAAKNARKKNRKR